MSNEYKLNTDKSVAVSYDTFFNEDLSTCPKGVKVQLLGAGGVAVYSQYKGEDFWIGWCPVPKRAPKQSLEELEGELKAMGYNLDELDKDNPYNN
jgi:hypothetical protein